MSGDLNELLSHAPESRKLIDGHGETLKKMYESKTPFDSSNVQNELESDLQQIQEYIISLSKKCLHQLNEWNQSLMGMDTNINEVVGILQRVKADAGSKIIAPILCEGAESQNDISAEDIPTCTQFNFPDYPFEINTHILDEVGHHPNEVSEGKVDLGPLIIKIPPGEQPPRFWDFPQDYFSPPFEKSMPEEEYQTSFSSFFGFNPIPEYFRQAVDQLAEHQPAAPVQQPKPSPQPQAKSQPKQATNTPSKQAPPPPTPEPEQVSSPPPPPAAGAPPPPPPPPPPPKKPTPLK